MTKKTFILFALIIAMTATTQAAQDAIPNFSQLFSGARSASLGSNSPLLNGDLNGTLINPAVLSSVDKNQFSLTNSNVLDTFNYFAFGAAFGWRHYHLAIGYGSTIQDGIDTTQVVNGRVRSTDTYSAGFRLLYGSIAVPYSSSLWRFEDTGFGLTGKVIQQVVGSTSRYGYGADLGLVTSLPISPDYIGAEKVQFGLSVLNAFSKFAPGSNGGSSALNRQFVYGVRTDVLDNKLSLFLNNSIEKSINLGAEYAFPNGLSLRGSSDGDRFHIGTGILLKDILNIKNDTLNLRLDYDYSSQSNNEAGMTHTFGFTLMPSAAQKRPKITSPKKTVKTSDRTLRLAGIGPRNTKIFVRNGNESAITTQSDGSGRWEIKEYPLKDGVNRLCAQAYSLENNYSPESDPVEIYSDRSAPKLSVTILPINTNQIRIELTTSEPLKTLTANYQELPLNFTKLSDTQFRADMLLPSQYANGSVVPSVMDEIVIRAKDDSDNDTGKHRFPIFATITSPVHRSIVHDSLIDIQGQADPNLAHIWIQGKEVRLGNQSNLFKVPVALEPGKNSIELKIEAQNGQVLSYHTDVLYLTTFVDLDGPGINKREIELIATLGLMKADSNNRFYPEKEYTRLAFARFLIHSQKLTPVRANQAVAADIALSDTFATLVNTALSKGWMTLNSANRFEPDAPVSEAEAVQILQKAGVLDANTPVSASRVPITKNTLAKLLANSAKYQSQIKEISTFN